MSTSSRLVLPACRRWCTYLVNDAISLLIAIPDLSFFLSFSCLNNLTRTRRERKFSKVYYPILMGLLPMHHRGEKQLSTGGGQNEIRKVEKETALMG